MAKLITPFPREETTASRMEGKELFPSFFPTFIITMTATARSMPMSWRGWALSCKNTRESTTGKMKLRLVMMMVKEKELAFMLSSKENAHAV